MKFVKNKIMKNKVINNKRYQLIRCVLGFCIICSLIFVGCGGHNDDKREEQEKQEKQVNEKGKTGFLKYLDDSESSIIQVEMNNLKLLLEVHLVELSADYEDNATKTLAYMEQNYCDREIDLAALFEAEDVFAKDVQAVLSEEEINTEWYKIKIEKDQVGGYQVTVLLKEE